MPISRIYNAASAGRRKQALSYSKGESQSGPEFTYGKFTFDYSINFQGLQLGFEDKTACITTKETSSAGNMNPTFP